MLASFPRFFSERPADADFARRAGRKRIRRLCAIGLSAILMTALAGCREKPTSRRPQPAASNSPAAAALDQADAHFEAGRFAEAADAYDSALADYPSSESSQILFRQALAHLLESIGRGRSRAIPILEKLAATERGSSLGGASRVILDLLEEVQHLARSNAASEKRVEQLSEELEKLKKIDMRRRPPRP